MNSPSPKESRNDMVVFTCKDRFDDIMTCIYEAWASHLGHNNIKLRTEPLGTMELFCEYRHVEADKEKTECDKNDSAKDFLSCISDGISCSDGSG